MGRERGAGRAGVRDTPASRTRIPGAASAGARRGSPRPEPFPGRGGMLRARRSAPRGSAGYTTAPAGGSPAGPQARAYATAALLTQFHRGPKSRHPSLGLPSRALRTPGPGSRRRAGVPARHAPGHRGIPCQARGSVGREAPERQPASPGRWKVIAPPARSRGPAPEGGSPYLG